MVDYISSKVPELKKLLQDRQLPISGNKADLIARLQEDDNKKAGVSGMSNTFLAYAIKDLSRMLENISIRAFYLTSTSTSCRRSRGRDRLGRGRHHRC